MRVCMRTARREGAPTICTVCSRPRNAGQTLARCTDAVPCGETRRAMSRGLESRGGSQRNK